MSSNGINSMVVKFVSQLEFTTTLESIIKMQEMKEEELTAMILTHFSKYKKLDLTSEELQYVINSIHNINATELVKDIYTDSHVEVTFEEVEYENAFLQTLATSLEQFIKYASRYVYDKKDYGTIRSEYNKYLELAKHLRQNLDKVALHIHKHCHTDVEVVYPRTMLKNLYNYRYFCYNDSTYEPSENFNTLEQQNEKAKNYVHYDFSVNNKRIKVLS